MQTVTAHNGVPIPNFMYGTAWKKEHTTRHVHEAVRAGFRAIDTANQLIHYQEALAGDALHTLEQQGITRDQLFLQTKFTSVSGQDHRTPYDPRAAVTQQVEQSFESSLAHLQTGYLDSYVLHGPSSREGLDQDDWEIWAAMERLYQSGRARMIGISNVRPGQLQQLCERATVIPMVVQNRCFAALGWDRDIRAICKTHHIIYQGFSLLTANLNVIYDPAVSAMAKRVNTGPAQIIFRFAQQMGMLPLTGTTDTQHMKDDLGIGAFELTPEELAHLETLAG